MIDHGPPPVPWHGSREKKKEPTHTDTRPANAHAPVYHTPCLGGSRGQEAGGSGRDPSRSHVSHERLVLEAGYRVICIATLPCLKGDDGLYSVSQDRL